MVPGTRLLKRIFLIEFQRLANFALEDKFDISNAPASTEWLRAPAGENDSSKEGSMRDVETNLI